MDECARNRDALHLATRELVRKALPQAFEFDPFKGVRGRLRERRFSSEEQRQFDVFENRQGVKQLKRLKNEADAPRAAAEWRPAVIQGTRSKSVQRTLPEVGKSMAPARLSSVDFPQPLRPTNATNSPCSTFNETPLSACTGWPSVR